MKVGERVAVEAQHISGTGKIVHIAPGEIWPVQVELDEPIDGSHRMTRVAMAEIKPADEKYLAEVIKPRLGYRLGDRYLVGPASVLKDHFNVYLLNGRLIGTYKDMFLEKAHSDARDDVLEKSNTNTPVKAKEGRSEPKKPKKRRITITYKPKKETVVDATEKIKAKKRKKTFAEEMEEEGQINIFDLLEG